MTRGLRILAAGPGVTIQDKGRHGWQRFGVTVAGPMDWIAHATANLAVGGTAGQAAIEISLGGLEATAEGGPLLVALSGGSYAISYDGQPMPPAVRLWLQPGSRLSVRAGAAGMWCYLAVAGGLAVPPVLGSQSTHTRSHMGGLDGRMLRAHDILPVNEPAGLAAAEGPALRIIAPWLAATPEPLGVIPGPQDDYFAPDQMAAFLGSDWRLGPRGDRMAYALEGPQLRHAKGHDIVSDAIAAGAVQVPGSGQPFVLMADRQPTGGYPKIATLIGPDRARLAQTRPGDSLRFQRLSVEDAVARRRALFTQMNQPIRLEPIVRTSWAPEDLLAINLVSGVINSPHDE